MIHRRALITGLLASVAAPTMARLAPIAPDMLAFSAPAEHLWEHYGMPTPYGWLTYWDGEYICRREVSWNELYQRD